MEAIKKETIGDTEYSFLRLGARKGMTLRAKLVKVVAPILLGLGAGKNGLNAELTEEHLAAAARGLSSLDSETVVGIVEGLMEAVLIAGKPAQAAWDRHFSANYADLDRVLMEVIRHNGFFGQLGAALSRLPS